MDFLTLIDNWTQASADDLPELERTVADYPWFIPGKILLMSLCLRCGRTADSDRMRRSIALHLAAYPASDWMLENPDFKKLQRQSSFSIIETFLASDSHRIVPDESFAAPGEAAPAVVSDDDLVSESLAEIYRKQGLVEESKATYRKLSLKFPEKSVYFAGILTEIEQGK
ncbi:MAG: hypothetical protein LBU80_05835 [Rikenellaceae bacterium]|jgi:hypothetical protein|nr:hypothetical protein [Rikenellaceae bacterium]